MEGVKLGFMFFIAYMLAVLLFRLDGLRGDVQKLQPSPVVTTSPTPSSSPSPSPRSTPTRASRSRVAPRRTLNWAALAQCESSGNRHAVSPNGLYFGLYQFELRTWLSNGGHGSPAQASAAEQTRIAERLFAKRGIQPWPVCGPKLLARNP